MAPRHKSVETKHHGAARTGVARAALARPAQLSQGRGSDGGRGAGQGPVGAALVPAGPRRARRRRRSRRAVPFAYISDTHLYDKKLNERFVRAALKAVDDVNALIPQPDFVLFGGDLAQLGKPEELAIGAQILKEVKAPVKMMVGEHDWFLDLGERWKSLFGAPSYSFDHKGVHIVVLMSVVERDFWTQRKMTPEERMHTVAGLDNGTQSRFEVGDDGRAWLKNDLAKVPHTRRYRLLALAALQVLPRLELLDRRRRRGAGDLAALSST